MSVSQSVCELDWEEVEGGGVCMSEWCDLVMLWMLKGKDGDMIVRLGE